MIRDPWFWAPIVIVALAAMWMVYWRLRLKMAQNTLMGMLQQLDAKLSADERREIIKRLLGALCILIVVLPLPSCGLLIAGAAGGAVVGYCDTHHCFGGKHGPHPVRGPVLPTHKAP